MPLKTRIFHEISAVCNRHSNLSEIPISNQSQNPTRDDEANANRRTQTADRPSTKPVPRSVFSRLAFALCALAHIASCDIVVPPDPPLPARDVAADDFVWGEIEIHREYDFIGVARVDCSLVLSTLTGHGICAPAKHPIGDVVSCPLAPPGANMIVSCLSADDVPAVYAQISWASDAGELDFSRIFGACRYEMAGPAAGRDARYDTDKGYKVCLFDEIAPYSRLLGQDKSLRPSGLYVDFSSSTFVPDPSDTTNPYPVFSSPDAIVLDARLLDPEERKAAFDDLFKLFEFYSSLKDN